MITIVTATAPVNIAVVKYWGKRNESLLLPINGSISGTLDQNHMRAKTSACTSPNFVSDRFWLNNIEQSINTRLQNVLNEIRKRAKAMVNQKTGVHWDQKVHICSENNFPTAAGLASSAAGYACLAFVLAKLFGIEGNVSDIARLGSGSACRSLYGGFVEWQMGLSSDGSDSIARPIADESHWPDMSVLILVVNTGKKHTGSTDGMELSVQTSQLLKYRADSLVPQTMIKMKKAILERDFETFAELTMKESNQMHATCMDTYPPIFYMTDISKSIIRLVHSINNFFGNNRIAYTFDAGPNACFYLLSGDVPLVVSLVQHFFPPSRIERKSFITGIPVPCCRVDEKMIEKLEMEIHPEGIQYMINTKLGSGPQILPLSESLLDGTSGLPF